MSKDEQDDEILSALVVEDKMTAYALSKETEISVPQINFRMVKLVSIGVVKQVVEDGKTSYSVHPVLKSKESIEDIALHIKEIFDIIDNTEETSIDGIKSIIGFIVSKTSIDISELPNIPNVLESTESLISIYINIIKAHAEKYNYKINSASDEKIKWMALNNRRCFCAKDTRVCPCPESVDEIRVYGKCKCSLFLG